VAEDVVEHTVATSRAEPEALVEPRRPREQPRIHRWRFGIAYLALAVVAGLGVGGTILLYERPADPEEPAWSSWRPVGRETSYPDQIADYVGQRYRLPSGRQLAVVAASPPRVTTGEPVPVQAVIIQNQSPLPSAAREFEYVRTQDTIMYELCGLGQQCSISEGEPSTERLQLLRREALELSLYTFKYVEGAESTIVMLPPSLGEDPQDARDDQAMALFLQKKDFARELALPVRHTLLRATAPSIARLNPREDLVVKRLTDPNIFQYQFQQAPTGGALVLLAPINARR
jgi:hypothetical protein